MRDMIGFECDPVALTALSGQLTGHAGQAEALTTTLGGITADTGRSDSDEMGRIGPGAVAELLGRMRTELDDDSGQVTATAAEYVLTDQGRRDVFSRISGRQ